MRNPEEILSLIINVAKEDKRIRAVLLNGSRANRNVKADKYQDFDVIYIVSELLSFRQTPNWINTFGERIVMQQPDLMDLGEKETKSNLHRETYLMLFKDTNRIDLTLILKTERNLIRDSLTELLLDKDNLYRDLPESSDIDYWIQRPSDKQFKDCCNEFWWVVPYVVKGLLRGEIIYAKYMFDNPVRKMFMRMLSWYVGIKTNFTVNIGKSQKFLKENIDIKLWKQVLLTYSDADEERTWDSLEEMMDIFDEKANEVSQALNYEYNLEESINVQEYVKLMKIEFIKKHSNK